MFRRATKGLALAALVLSQTVLSPAALARVPAAAEETRERARTDMRALLGRPVVLSNGSRIGQVAATWPNGTGSILMQIRIDARLGLGSDALTLIVPGPIDPGKPIRLLLDQATFQALVSVPFN